MTLLKRSNKKIKVMQIHHKRSKAQLQKRLDVLMRQVRSNNSLCARISFFLNKDQIKIVNAQYKKISNCRTIL